MTNMIRNKGPEAPITKNKPNSPDAIMHVKTDIWDQRKAVVYTVQLVNKGVNGK
jgi:hypothetical protein